MHSYCIVTVEVDEARTKQTYSGVKAAEVRGVFFS